MMGKDFDDLAAIKEAKEEEEHTEEDIVIKAVDWERLHQAI